MQEIEKHHRMLDLRNAYGKDEKWLAIDCAFIESGILYAQNHGCKRVAFGSVDDSVSANKVSIEVLGRFLGLEGIVWQIPIAKQADFSGLYGHRGLKYLSIVQPNLTIDLSSFPNLEYFSFLFSEGVSGFEGVKNLRSIKVSKLTSDLGFLGAVKSLVQLSVERSSIESLAGIERIESLQDLSLTLCAKLSHIADASLLKKLKTLRIDGARRLTDLSVLDQFDSLETLWIQMKAIDSCGFISRMKSLRFASLNAEIGDDDLSPILDSKTMKEVWFSPSKKTYRPKLSPDEINNLLSARKS